MARLLGEHEVKGLAAIIIATWASEGAHEVFGHLLPALLMGVPAFFGGASISGVTPMGMFVMVGAADPLRMLIIVSGGVLVNALIARLIADRVQVAVGFTDLVLRAMAVVSGLLAVLNVMPGVLVSYQGVQPLMGDGNQMVYYALQLGPAALALVSLYMGVVLLIGAGAIARVLSE